MIGYHPLSMSLQHFLHSTMALSPGTSLSTFVQSHFLSTVYVHLFTPSSLQLSPNPSFQFSIILHNLCHHKTQLPFALNIHLVVSMSFSVSTPELQRLEAGLEECDPDRFPFFLAEVRDFAHTQWVVMQVLYEEIVTRHLSVTLG